MNKGIKESKSDTKRVKNISKIATRVTSEKKRSPNRGKDRSSSVNSLVVCDGVESPKKLIQKEVVKPKTVNEISNKKAYDFKKSVEFNDKSLKDQRTTQSSELSIKTTEDQIEDSTNLKSKLNQKEKIFDELIAREGSIEKLLQIKKPAKTVFNIDDLSSTEIRQSLARVDDKTAKPFSFLNDIVDPRENDKTKINVKDQELNPTDIDLQLSSLVKRVELNRTLLERTNQRIKEINFLAERNRMISIRDMNYDEESYLKIKDAGDTASKKPVSAAADLTTVSHPAVEELRKTMSSTIEMLQYVHKMSNGDLASGEIPPELTDYLNIPITAKENL